ncbi:MAG TPA: bpX6 domain-containing protein, partial [Kofleriaceae bacterium]|nr:bpX6 domain-containing protein [Kofleriaceae bacterium]
MTAGPRLRRFAHRGSVAAIGVVIDRAGLGEAEARARVLAWWAPGGEVRDVDGAWILRWPVARRMTVAAAPGGPLVATHGVVATLPLTAAEVAALAAPSGAVVLATGGGLRVVVAGQGSAVDPAAWLEVDALEVVEVTSLGAPPTVVVVPAPVRVELGVAAADPDAAAVRTALLRPGAASSAAAGAPAP